MPNTNYSKLLILLGQERAAIIAGDFDGIQTLSPTKIALFDAVIQDRTKIAALPTLQKALARNQVLLGAAIQGVESARLRIKALREVRDGLRIYDRSGQIDTVSSMKRDFCKRS